MDKATEYKNLGNEAFKNKKFQEAADLFTKAIEINPNDHVFYSNRSGAYASLENYEKALEDASKCVTLKPDWSKGYQRKGLAEFYLSKYDEAISTYEVGLKLEPTNQQLKEGLERAKDEKEQFNILNGVEGGVGSGFGGQVPEGVDNKFLANLIGKLQQSPKTREYLKDKDFVSKLQLLGKNPALFSTLSQSDHRIQEALQVMLGGFDFSQFGGAGDKAEEEEIPTGHQPHQHGANCSHDHDHGASHSHATTQQQPKKPEQPKKEEPKKQEPVVELDEADKKKAEGNEHYKKKDFTKALEFYQQAIDLKPTELLFYNNKAACYIELGDLDKALEACQEALRIKEEHCIYTFDKVAKVYARLGSIYAKKEEYATSLDWYKKSLIENNDKNVAEESRRIERLKKQKEETSYINPQLAEEASERGKQLFLKGDYPSAMKEYAEATKRAPNGAKYYFNRGLCYQKLLELPLAVKDYEKCLELDANYLKAYTKKADCHFTLKEYHKALSFFEKGLALDPNNAECQAGIQKTQMQIYQGGGSQEEQEARARQAMSDPEIQNILRTPEVQNALKAIQNDPKEVKKVLSDPSLAAKIEKLIQAGILKVGP